MGVRRLIQPFLYSAVIAIPVPASTSSFAAIAPGGALNDRQTSLIYRAATGELAVNAPLNMDGKLTTIQIDSAEGIFTRRPCLNIDTISTFEICTDHRLFKGLFGTTFGSVTFGQIVTPGLSQDFLLKDFTVVGSITEGGELGSVDLIYIPEPEAHLLLSLGVLVMTSGWSWQHVTKERCGRRNRHDRSSVTREHRFGEARNPNR